jgi:predicted HTH transcriptional regulator
VRNRAIVRILRELHLMEILGSGYERISTTFEHGYPEPDWRELGVVVRVTIPTHPFFAEGVMVILRVMMVIVRVMRLMRVITSSTAARCRQSNARHGCLPRSTPAVLSQTGTWRKRWESP